MERPKMTEEERAAREKRHREREDRRHKEGRSGRPRKPKGLDVIDKLDVTGIYGPGRKLQLSLISCDTLADPCTSLSPRRPI